MSYEKHSARFREAWTVGREQAQIAHIALNDMIRSLRKEHPDWTLHHIVQKISGDHQDLEGFSQTQIYRELDNENRQLVQKKSVPLGKDSNPKKEPEQSDIDEGAEAEKAYMAEKAYEQSADTFTKPAESLDQIRARAIPPPPEADSNNLDVVTVGRYGLFDTKKTAEVLTRDLGRLKSSGWKIAEITARHIS